MNRLLSLVLLSVSGLYFFSTDALALNVVMQKVGEGTVTSIPGAPGQPTNGIHCSTGCSIAAKTTYTAGTPVAYLAEASEGYDFDHWEGACSGALGSTICSFTVSTNHVAKAVFVKRTTLAACPALGTSVPVFTNFPFTVGNVTNATPVGGVDTDDHTFPNWHMFAAASPSPLPFNAEPVYTPSAVTLLHVMRVVKGGDYNYYLRMASCDGVELLVAIVSDFSPYLLALIQANGAPYANFAGMEIWNKVNISLSANFYLGTVRKSDRQIALEVYDRRRPTASFTTLGRYRAAHTFIQCPLEYFTNLGSSNPLTALLPVCGRVDQDLSGTLQGNWFLSTEEWGIDLTKHISFTNDYVGTPRIAIGKNSALQTAIGSAPYSIYNVSGQTLFSGVTQATGKVCYTVVNSVSTPMSLLVHMNGTASLRAKVSPLSCATLAGFTIDTAPSTMAAPLTFVR